MSSRSRIRKIATVIRKIVIVILVVAAAGTGGVWALSCQRYMGLAVVLADNTFVNIFLCDGRLSFLCIDTIPEERLADYRYLDRGLQIEPAHAMRPFCEYAWRTWGRIFEFRTPIWFGDLQSRKSHVTTAVFGAWVIPVALLIYPAATFARGPLRRWRRKRNGACRKCGYDLTGNVSGVCPECGAER